MKRPIACALGLALLTSSYSCGGSKGPTTPTDDAVAAGTAAIAPDDFAVVAFTLGSGAPLRTQLDWSLPANDMDAFLIRGTCSRADILNARPDCTTNAVVVGVGTGVGKPELFVTAALDAGPYTLLVVNRGSQNDTCNYRVTKSG